jgi:hypothetical protein
LAIPPLRISEFIFEKRLIIAPVVKKIKISIGINKIIRLSDIPGPHLKSFFIENQESKGLLEKDRIRQTNGSYVIYDLFFARWIRRIWD